MFIVHCLPEPAKSNKVLRAWSLYWNTGRLLTLADTSRSLHCLDGIRALSVLWIILFHTAGRVMDDCVNKSDIMYGPISRQKYLWAFTGHIAVDSFFVLSGLLLVYTTSHKTKQLSLKHLPLFYCNRYMRLFPLLATAVLLQMVLPRLVDGPVDAHLVRYVSKLYIYLRERPSLRFISLSSHYQSYRRASDNIVEWCRSYWWSALLHVQNIVNPTDMCLGHTWYLSVDMQLFMVSPLLLRWVLRRCFAWRALVTAVLVSQALKFAICLYFNYPDVWGQLGDTLPGAFYLWYYINPLARSPPFLIGMLLGYTLHVHRNEKIQLSKVTMTYVVSYSDALGMIPEVVIYNIQRHAPNAIAFKLVDKSENTTAIRPPVATFISIVNLSLNFFCIAIKCIYLLTEDLYVNRISFFQWSVFLCYSLALVLSLSVVFVEHPSMQAFWANRIALNIRHAVYRSGWALAVCWLIFACVNDYGGPINWFLSLKLWRFVARISYAMYLFSYILQTNISGVGAGAEYYFDTQSLLTRYAADLAYTTALSVGACIVVEGPLLTLYNLLLTRIRNTHEQYDINNKHEE
ncbi:nose resistant to fluoxetine protein 6-like [Cydia pomonella]|uniref:nose resistant to fluoxetine protein 6-like n=1 Tax=Cydia pomonella TaxID=82600 RepID=UPI002ADD61BC|nr:nose resistant to fluoxetine protein 6-like [Cydia pomonella]